jgi:hypothetical protein
MVASSAAEAIDNAQATTRCDPGYCLRYVRTWLEIGSHYASAIDAWNGAAYRHPGDRNPPPGVPLFYAGGQYGHIVLGLHQAPNMRTTDAPSSGKVTTQEIAWCEQAWGYDYLGWTEDLNTVTIPWSDQEDTVKEEDIEAIASRVNKTLGDYLASGEPRDPADPDPEQGNKRLVQIDNRLRRVEEKVDRLLGE